MPHPGDVETRLWTGWLRIVLREGDIAAGNLVVQVTGPDADELSVTWQPAPDPTRPAELSDLTELNTVGQGWTVLIDRAAWAHWLRTGNTGNEARLTTGPVQWLAPDLRVAFGDHRFALPAAATPFLLRLAVI